MKRTRGALVNGLVPDGPAERAGIKAGDIILDVGGREVREGRDLLRAVLQHPVGAKIAVTVQRDGAAVKLNLVTTERPNAERSAQRGGGQQNAPQPTMQGGINLMPLTPDVARKLSYAGPGGVVVASVAPGSMADRAGLMRGDVIEEVNRQPAQSPKQVMDAMRKGRMLLKLHRQGGTFFTVLGGN